MVFTANYRQNENMEIQLFDNMDDLTQSFTSWFIDIASEKGQLTVALSGGSTPKRLFDYWASLPKDTIDWRKIKLFWGDERCVPPNDEDSNYKMTKERLLDLISIPQENIFRIHGENAPDEESERYSLTLNHNIKSESGIPVFDIMILGMGDDGHTASIFPHEMSLWDSQSNCVVATHPTSGQKRVSVTGKVINASKHVVFLVTGDNKAEKVKEIFEYPEESKNKYPAARVNPDSGSLTWFMDEKAAKLIKA